jgi:hypothetical protein
VTRRAHAPRAVVVGGWAGANGAPPVMLLGGARRGEAAELAAVPRETSLRLLAWLGGTA